LIKKIYLKKNNFHFTFAFTSGLPSGTARQYPVRIPILRISLRSPISDETIYTTKYI